MPFRSELAVVYCSTAAAVWLLNPDCYFFSIVRLSKWFVDREDNIEPDIRGISDSTGTLPTFLTIEPEGRILRNEGDVLRPTGGFVHIYIQLNRYYFLSMHACLRWRSAWRGMVR
eukprot:SAG25_NODE_30_length_20554_cov_36.028694_2_plen_115_part_00